MKMPQSTKTYYLLPLFIFFALALQSCTTNPVTGKRELSFYSTESQIRMGEQNYIPGQQSQGGQYYLDPALNDYIERVGKKLAAVSDVPTLPYEFVVLNNGVPNAWAMPGGKIAINRGLLVELEDEAELAAVLGHEIVHAAAGHGASQLSRGTLFGIGTTVAAIAGTQTEQGNLIALGAQAGAAAWSASYGRNDELESDEFGMLYMSRAGYDPKGAVELQRTFVELSGGRQTDFISGLFASHPPSQSRVDANIQTATQLPAGGFRGRAEYQAAIAQIKKDEAAYEAEGLAIQALNDKKPEEALKQLDAAIAVQPNEGSFWELRGHAWQMQGNDENALKAFSTAISKNDNYYRHWLARGLLNKQIGKSQAAESDFARSQSLLPNAVSAFNLGELAEARGDTDTAIGYYTQVASAGGDIGNAAQSKLIRYELPKNPNKYLASGFFLSQQGELIAVVENRSSVAVSNVIVNVASRETQKNYEFAIRGTIDPGQQASVRTGFKGDAANYATFVVKASVE